MRPQALGGVGGDDQRAEDLAERTMSTAFARESTSTGSIDLNSSRAYRDTSSRWPGDREASFAAAAR